MRKWLDEYKMPQEMIYKALDKTIISTGKVSYPYAESVIKKWHDNDIFTAESADKNDEEFAKSNISKNNKNTKTREERKPRASKSKIVNYKGRTWDYEKLAELEQAHLEKSLRVVNSLIRTKAH